jgi:hypothetical protein
MKMAVFWDVTLCSQVEVYGRAVVCTSETSVNFYQTTRRNIPEDSHLIEHLLCNQIVHHRVQKSPPLDSNVRQLNPVNTLFL